MSFKWIALIFLAALTLAGATTLFILIKPHPPKLSEADHVWRRYMGRRPEQCTPEAQQGLLHSASLRNINDEVVLAANYMEGYCVKKDPGQAIEWYRKVAAQGNATAYPALARIYSEGIGVPKDLSEAYFWAEAAVSSTYGAETWVLKLHDEIEAKLSPQQVIDIKNRVIEESEKNYDTITKVLNDLQEKAAQGDVLAEYLLGKEYRRGGPDFQRGIAWNLLAAKRNYAPALRDVAVEAVVRTNPNYPEGYFWISLAARSAPNNIEYSTARERYSSKLTSSEREAADERIRNWKPEQGPVAASEVVPLGIERLRSPSNGYFGSLNNPVNQLKSHVMAWISIGLNEAQKEGRITWADYQNLDFTRPGEPGYGDHPEFEIFNPKSPRSIVRHRMIYIPQRLLDNITNAPGARPFLNIRASASVSRGDSIDETMYVVIPDIREDICDPKPPNDASANTFFNMPPRTIDVPPDNSTVAVDRLEDGPRRSFFYPCNRDASRKDYYFLPIAVRSKKATDVAWPKPSKYLIYAGLAPILEPQ